MVLYNGSKTNQESYRCHLICKGHGIEILADLPETFNLGVQSDWESPLPTSLAGILDNLTAGMATKISQFVGVQPQLQALSYQIWMGTSPLEIPLTLLFDAHDSGLEDVFKPITALMQMAFPVLNGSGLLMPPGPRGGFASLVNGSASGYGIDVRVGKMMIFSNCILAAASETYDMKNGADGYPISGSIDLTLRTSFVYSTQDFLTSMQF